MPVSPRRADTRRNHERILVAAAESLKRTGALSYNAIAKRAEIGVGTVYRHFPTPEDLILAVYDREVRHLVEVVPALLERHSPEDAFRAWVVDHLAHYMMTKRGLSTALQAIPGALPKYVSMLDALESLRQANVDAGTIRADLTAETLMRGLGGLLYLTEENWKAEAEATVDLVWRGMRVRCPRCGE
ncbi:TetR/AcrR family transcriptional regulator [Amycolatopsis jiangsuensis]|uniref:AcrR family transcriptional regulator n=1 Tax=Amycolatopsis jiangsuensis TaxID=1181879 RepID=A0A840IXR1_9PSEU|nr:TetR/AcrR family transcriptional regulator [Amycolatopsis jiangsuensis]MBB4685938.1 AcrR family transcriptional regulator [Amycolatopsis jiangsuensis]